LNLVVFDFHVLAHCRRRSVRYFRSFNLDSFKSQVSVVSLSAGNHRHWQFVIWEPHKVVPHPSPNLSPR